MLVDHLRIARANVRELVVKLYVLHYQCDYISAMERLIDDLTDELIDLEDEVNAKVEQISDPETSDHAS